MMQWQTFNIQIKARSMASRCPVNWGQFPSVHHHYCAPTSSFQLEKTAAPFATMLTIFDLRKSIIRINIRTKFHEDWTINVTSIALTGFYYIHITKTAPPAGGHVFQRTGTIFDLN
ncbi:hypothetical protein DPMN_136156 [Dreissena polymorpha]|uniref:Uncharacterized protein n=1 Tax=Dreissena polymorpha TaxID=45954 RepID=A0A9D4G339_DREPO|nr:hypothetical protein DPMN_136156 [Dreissena polymorpha]